MPTMGFAKHHSAPFAGVTRGNLVPPQRDTPNAAQYDPLPDDREQGFLRRIAIGAGTTLG
jgi:hypothetical protein